MHYAHLPLLIAFFLLAVGCVPMPTRTDTSVEGATTPLASQEAVVLFAGRPEPLEPAAPARRADTGQVFDLAAPDNLVNELVRCMTRALQDGTSRRADVIDPAAFTDALFPWFEGETAPSSVSQLRALLERPAVRKRIDDLKLRYLVHVSATWEAQGLPWLWCGGGAPPAGAGCLGVGWENAQVAMVARIWDVSTLAETAASSVTRGRSFGIALGLPLVFAADTAKGACRAGAAQLDGLLERR